MPRVNRNSRHNGRSGNINQKNPWRAQVKLNGSEVYLGGYPTWQLAYEAEQSFRLRHGLPHHPKKSRSKHPAQLQLLESA